MKRLFIILVLLMTIPVFAGLDAKGGKVINVATPTDSTDATNKQYVDDTGTETSGINVKDYGALGDGSNDDTAAIQLAIAALPSTGGTIFFPPGTFITDTIVMPDYPKRLYLIGSGRTVTTLQALNTNSPILKGVVNIISGHATPANYFYGFNCKAHASGSTGAAFDLRKCSFSNFQNIEFEINGSGQWTYGFLLDATDHCYSNNFDDILLRHSDAIVEAVVRIETHANLHFFKRFIVAGFGEPKAVFSFKTESSVGNGSKQIVIEECHFEGLVNTDPAVIDIGEYNKLIVRNCYFENVVKAFDESKTNSDCYIESCYFASSPGVSQGTELPSNYSKWNNPTGGSNVANTLDALQNLRIYNTSGTAGRTIRLYETDSTSGFLSMTFNGTDLNINYPMRALRYRTTNSGLASLVWGTSTPEGAVTARVGSVFLRTDGGANTTLYIKESGTGNTGWIAPATVSSDPPATATSTGIAGTITYDSDYFYVAVATDTWKRAAITTWAVVTENVIFAGENVIFAGEQVVY